jgi:hypothetical protein
MIGQGGILEQKVFLLTFKESEVAKSEGDGTISANSGRIRAHKHSPHCL